VPLAIVSHHTLPWLPLKRCARGPADSQARSLIVTGPQERVHEIDQLKAQF
jgi:hypothetical protein